MLACGCWLLFGTCLLLTVGVSGTGWCCFFFSVCELSSWFLLLSEMCLLLCSVSLHYTIPLWLFLWFGLLSLCVWTLLPDGVPVPVSFLLHQYLACVKSCYNIISGLNIWWGTFCIISLSSRYMLRWDLTFADLRWPISPHFIECQISSPYGTSWMLFYICFVSCIVYVCMNNFACY